MLIVSLVNGCVKDRVDECKNNPFPFKTKSFIKYSLSPKIGLPIVNKCLRNWCFLPVLGVNLTKFKKSNLGDLTVSITSNEVKAF